MLPKKPEPGTLFYLMNEFHQKSKYYSDTREKLWARFIRYRLVKNVGESYSELGKARRNMRKAKNMLLKNTYYL